MDRGRGIGGDGVAAILSERHEAARGRVPAGSKAPDGRLSILHVANSMGAGGLEALVFQLCRAQARDGHAVTLATFVAPDELDFAGERARAREDALRAAGVRVAHLGARVRGNPLTAGLRLRRLGRFDVIHSHLLRGSAAVAAALLPGARVFTHHSTPIHVSRTAFRLMSAGTDLFVAISEAGRRPLAETVGGPVAVVPNGIDLERFRPCPAHPEDRPLTVMATGNLLPAKNYPMLIRAADRLRRILPGVPVRFRIAGEGVLRLALEAEIAARGLDDRIELLGSRTDIADLLNQADLFLMTSAYEGLPLAIMEAMACGLPVVATDVGGCGELVAEGVTGHLVPPDDADAAARSLAGLIAAPERRRAMGGAAVERVRAFSVAQTHEGYLAAYRRALAGRRTGDGAAPRRRPG